MVMQKISGEANESWNGKDSSLKVGDKIHGFYTGKKTNVGKFNATIYIIEDENDKRWDVWGGTVIDSAFEQIKQGAEVEIEFAGTKPSDKGNPVKLYEVSADNDYAETDKKA